MSKLEKGTIKLAILEGFADALDTIGNPNVAATPEDVGKDDDKSVNCVEADDDDEPGNADV